MSEEKNMRTIRRSTSRRGPITVTQGTTSGNYPSDSEVRRKLDEMRAPPPSTEDRLRQWASQLSRKKLESEVVSLWKKTQERRRDVVNLTRMLNSEVKRSDRLRGELAKVRVDFSTLEGEK